MLWSMRITISGKMGKPTLSPKWKAAVSGARGQVPETPPGSASRACDERVARELGRAGCLLARKPETRSAGEKRPGAGRRLPSPRSEPSETGHTKPGGVSKVSPREVTNGALRDGLPAVLAEHSTESLRQLSRLGRWGTEAQGTHCREGEAGQNRSWREQWARHRAHYPCTAPSAESAGLLTFCASAFSHAGALSTGVLRNRMRELRTSGSVGGLAG